MASDIETMKRPAAPSSWLSASNRGGPWGVSAVRSRRRAFDLNWRTSLSSQRPNDQGFCCSVFDDEKRSLEDWHKLYITAALTSVTLKESVRRGSQGKEFAGHMIGVIRKVNSKKAEGPGFVGRCPRQLD
jgi:hypothetical protein